jgi:hypothetical protein
MALFGMFKKRRKDDYLEVTPPAEEGGYGPAGYPGMPPQGMPPQGMPGMENMPAPEFPPMQQQMPPPLMQPSMAPPEMEHLRQQVESINYKLDTLKAVLDSINSRLANVESALKAAPTERGEGWTY